MKASKPYIVHILEEIDFLLSTSAELTFSAFRENESFKRAFVRSLEIIGEAAKKTPAQIRQQYPEIPWRKMSAMRDKLIHFYFGVDYQVVWSVIRDELPGLRDQMQNLLSELESSDEQAE